MKEQAGEMGLAPPELMSGPFHGLVDDVDISVIMA